MTPEERQSLAVSLFEMNRTMRDLKERMDVAADIAKQFGATELAFATYHLSDSISVYTSAMNRFVAGEINELS